MRVKEVYTMKKASVAAICALFFITGCGLFSETIKMNQVIAEKEKIDKEINPAKKQLLQLDLRDKRIIMDNVLVNDVTVSTNIDYDFCVISDITVGDKKVECFIYTKNIKTVASLEKGKSRINVRGTFSRFFSILDDYYTKMDIIKARIRLVEEETAEATTDKSKEKTEKKEEPEKNGKETK